MSKLINRKLNSIYEEKVKEEEDKKAKSKCDCEDEDDCKCDDEKEETNESLNEAATPADKKHNKALLERFEAHIWRQFKKDWKANIAKAWYPIEDSYKGDGNEIDKLARGAKKSINKLVKECLSETGLN